MAELKRSLSFPLVTFYGLGTILGAGIYVLIGSVAGVAGYLLPIAFLAAAVIAGFTAFSYAELVARLPRSAGEAFYVATAFGWRPLTLAVGYGSAAVGIISAATIASGFAGYLDRFFVLDPRLVMSVLVASLALIAAVGIRSAAWTATLMTVVEIAGLVLLYLAVGFVAVTAMTPIVLAASTEPLTIVAESFSVPGRLMSAIAIIAITNGALIQMIKSSRIIFGLARLGEAPAMSTRVGARTGTPLMATAAVAGSVLVLALGWSTIDLASLTSLMTLTIFTLVNAALVRLQRIAPRTGDVFACPRWVPYGGAGLSVLLILVQIL